MTDSPYRLASWNAADALSAVQSDDDRREVARSAAAYRAALAPCGRDWLKKRLSAMALAFGHERDPERAAAWLSETGRLLWDLPQDILADAIDEAIKRSDRGFMPAVGQIRSIADPLMAIRRQQASRLEAIAGVLDGRAARDMPAAAWEPKRWEPPAPEDDLIPADQIATFNRNMRKFGCTMRCDTHGVTFNLVPGQSDPTHPDAAVKAGAN